MRKNKKKNYFMFIVGFLLVVTCFSVCLTLAYFSDSDVIKSNKVNLPYIAKTVKLSGEEIEDKGGYYLTDALYTETTASIEITSNIPVILRLMVVQPIDGTISYNSKFTLSSDGYYYYNELVSNGSIIDAFTISLSQSDNIGFTIDAVQGNYFGLGAMLGYVRDANGDNVIEYSEIDYNNHKIIYNLSKSSISSVMIAGFNKAQEIVDLTSITKKEIQISAYGFNFSIVLNVSN